MSVYVDTSFLGSLYLRDANSPAAFAWLKSHPRALAFTPLHRHELRNAIWLAAFRGLIPEPTARSALAEIERDVAAGSLHATPIAWADALHESERLGDMHTARLGVRSLDLLHLGVARTLGAKTLLTFDQRQLAAAKAAGFHLGL